MAQTIQRKQKRKQPAMQAQDSTPPAPKRVRVAQTQTARKSTGGREPSQRQRGGGGDDEDEDDEGSGAPRAGPPSRQRMCTLFGAKLRAHSRNRGIDAWSARDRCRFPFRSYNRPRFCAKS
jgi:hypothetical protein